MNFLEYDHQDPAIRANPYPCYHSLRQTDPHHWSPTYERWLLTGYDDVASALVHPGLSSRRGADLAGKPLNAVEAFFSQWLLMSDAPDHTQLRTWMQKAFLPRIIAALRPRIQDIVNTLLHPMAEQKQVDLIAAYAFPLPAIVICELLGIPSEDRDQLKAWTSALSVLMATIRAGHGILEQAKQSVVELQNYFSRHLMQRRSRGQQTQDDFLGLMMQVSQTDAGFTDQQIVANAAMIVLAGHETTTNLIGSGVLTLLNYPDERTRLEKDPRLWAAAIEEMLRFESPVQWLSRIALQDLRVGTLDIAKGQRVMAMIGAANRDPKVFANPDVFDISRPPARHLAFGLGSHFCLGASLARLEAHLAILTLFERFPRLRLAPTTLSWRGDLGFRGLNALPVLLD